VSKEISFPREFVIGRVRRGRQAFIPRGMTVLWMGDILVVVAKGSAREEVWWCSLTDGNP